MTVCRREIREVTVERLVEVFELVALARFPFPDASADGSRIDRKGPEFAGKPVGIHAVALALVAPGPVFHLG